MCYVCAFARACWVYDIAHTDSCDADRESVVVLPRVHRSPSLQVLTLNKSDAIDIVLACAGQHVEMLNMSTTKNNKHFLMQRTETGVLYATN